MSKLWRHSDDVMFFATFEVFDMHIFYIVFERAHQGELKPEKLCPYHKNWIKYGIFKYEK